jgi:hypothetical protein
MYNIESFSEAVRDFRIVLDHLRYRQRPSDALRENFARFIYTLQQSIGATLDALPSGRSNQARKVNGDLFERLIRLLIVLLDVDCVAGTMQVPVKDGDGIELLRLWTHKLSFQANAVMIQSLVMEALNERRTFLAERRAVFTA